MLAGAERVIGYRPPANDGLSEDRISTSHQLPLGFLLPELVRGRCPYLLLGVVRRSWRERGIRTSGEDSFVGGQGAITRPAPANIRLQEENEYRRAQLRREARLPEESTSSH